MVIQIKTGTANAVEILNFYIVQRQPFRGVLSKRCSENMQQIYKRTLMPKLDFNKIAKYAANLQYPCRSVITLRHGCSPVNLLHIFRTPFTKNASGWLFLIVYV